MSGWRCVTLEIVKTKVYSSRLDPDHEGDGERQRRLHAEAQKCFGTLEGGDALLAEQASERVRRKLEAQRAANRSR